MSGLQIQRQTPTTEVVQKFTVRGYDHTRPISGLFGKVANKGDSHPRNGGLVVSQIRYVSTDNPGEWLVTVEYKPRPVAAVEVAI